MFTDLFCNVFKSTCFISNQIHGGDHGCLIVLNLHLAPVMLCSGENILHLEIKLCLCSDWNGDYFKHNINYLEEFVYQLKLIY